MIWDLHHLAVPVPGAVPVRILLLLDHEHERLMLARHIPDSAAVAAAASASIEQLGAPGILRSLQHQCTRELDEIYLARTPRTGQRAATRHPRRHHRHRVGPPRRHRRSGRDRRESATSLADLAAILPGLAWTSWPVPDD